MRAAKIYHNKVLAGLLTEETSSSYIFRYDNNYFLDSAKLPVSLTLSKKQQEYQSRHLFTFFSNMLSEGVNRKLQCYLLKIDENDDLGLLMATSSFDTTGSITVERVTENEYS